LEKREQKGAQPAIVCNPSYSGFRHDLPKHDFKASPGKQAKLVRPHLKNEIQG
jgi:hypothetical protein